MVGGLCVKSGWLYASEALHNLRYSADEDTTPVFHVVLCTVTLYCGILQLLFATLEVVTIVSTGLQYCNRMVEDITNTAISAPYRIAMHESFKMSHESYGPRMRIQRQPRDTDIAVSRSPT